MINISVADFRRWLEINRHEAVGLVSNNPQYTPVGKFINFMSIGINPTSIIFTQDGVIIYTDTATARISLDKFFITLHHEILREHRIGTRLTGQDVIDLMEYLGTIVQ